MPMSTEASQFPLLCLGFLIYQPVKITAFFYKVVGG